MLPLSPWLDTEKLADEGKNVILLAHSYGGVPVTESTKGLRKEERQAQGKKGGVVSLAYMTALVPAVGTSAAGVLADVQDDNRFDLKIDVRSLPPSYFLPTNTTTGKGLDVSRLHFRICCNRILGPS